MKSDIYADLLGRLFEKQDSFQKSPPGIQDWIPSRAYPGATSWVMGPLVGWKRISRACSHLILGWAIVVPFNRWRLWGSVYKEVWMKSKPRDWLQWTAFPLSWNCLLITLGDNWLLIIFRDTLFNLVASPSSLAVRLPLAISLLTLKLLNYSWLETVGFVVKCLFCRMFFSLTCSLPLTTVVLGYPQNDP